MEAVTHFLYLGSKISADHDCSFEIKRHLLLGRKAMTNQRQHIQKQRHQGFLGGSVVKNLPAVQEIWVRSLHKEDPLEKGMATHSSIIAWEISWTEEAGGLHP